MNNKFNIGDRVRVLTIDRNIVTITGMIHSAGHEENLYFIDLNGQTIHRIPESWIIERITEEG